MLTFWKRLLQTFSLQGSPAADPCSVVIAVSGQARTMSQLSITPPSNSIGPESRKLCYFLRTQNSYGLMPGSEGERRYCEHSWYTTCTTALTRGDRFRGVLMSYSLLLQLFCRVMVSHRVRVHISASFPRISLLAAGANEISWHSRAVYPRENVLEWFTNQHAEVLPPGNCSVTLDCCLVAFCGIEAYSACCRQ